MRFRKKVHMSAFTAAQSLRFTQKLAQKQNHVHAPHDQGRCSTVVEGHRIAIPQLQYGAGNDGLFSNAQVHFTGNPAIIPHPGDGFLEQTASEHIFV
jgi:hypothetical protein